VLEDLRFAIRSLSRRKGTLALAVLTLALGVGASTALFSVLNGVLLRPLPYRSPDRLAILWHVFGHGAQDLPALHALDYRDYRDRSRTLEQLTIATGQQQILGGEPSPQIVQVGYVAANFFPFLGVDPALGRHFTADDDVPGAARVALISHRLWQSRFGGAADITGTVIEINTQRVEVIGVMPPDLRLELPAETYALRDSDIWHPARINFAQQPPRNFTVYTVFARLAPGVTFAEAQEELAGIAGQLRAEVAEHNASDLRVKVIPFHTDVVKQAQGGLWLLMAAVGLVLAIACANVALLAMARARGRDRELMVRVAIGANRWRIGRLVFVESLLIAACGGIAGVILARLALLAVNTRTLADVPRLGDTSMDVTVLIFAAAVTTISAIGFGLLPAMKASRIDLADALRAAAVGSRSRAGGRGRDALIVSQIALGLILVIGAGLVVQSFRELATADPGFNASKTLTMRIATPPVPEFGTSAGAEAYHAELRARLSALPGVTHVGAITQLPLTGQGPLQPYAYDAETARNWEQLSADRFSVTTGYFDAVGARLLAGRDFTGDEIANRRRVIVIDESLADRAFGGASPALGRFVQLEPESAPESFFEVIGVVAHMRYHDLRRAQLPQIYRGGPFRTFSVAIRTAGDAAALGETAGRAASEMRPGTAVQDIRPLEDLVDEALGPMRLSVWLMTAFGAMALALAAIGIYGVFSYFVGERTREIAVRLALGATPGAVRALVVRRGLGLSACGVAAGLAGAFAARHAAGALLYGVSPLDAPTYAAAALCLIAVAIAACWLPAWRASRIDPQAGLRN
jgi:putative ABC transport system permease protein